MMCNREFKYPYNTLNSKLKTLSFTSTAGCCCIFEGSGTVCGAKSS